LSPAIAWNGDPREKKRKTEAPETALFFSHHCVQQPNRGSTGGNPTGETKPTICSTSSSPSPLSHG